MANITTTISNADDLAAVAGEAARHNKNFRVNLTPHEFFEQVAVGNMLKSWRHDHVNQDAQALKDRLQVVETEKNAEKQRAEAAEAELAAMKAAEAELAAMKAAEAEQPAK